MGRYHNELESMVGKATQNELVDWARHAANLLDLQAEQIDELRRKDREHAPDPQEQRKVHLKRYGRAPQDHYGRELEAEDGGV